MTEARGLLALVFLIGVTACDRPATEVPSEVAQVSLRSPVGPVPAEPQRAGDPEAGLAALLNNPYISCGPPYNAYKKTAAPTPATHQLPERRGLNAELPYNLTYFQTKDGVELVTSNCLSCHAGFFDGELIIGLGNENLDFTTDLSARAEALGAYVSGTAETTEWTRWADRMAAVAAYVRTDTVGPNPAIDLTWALVAHRDPETLTWSEQPLMQPPPESVLPVSMPPWWHMQKKHAMFYTTAGRGDHARHMILGTVFCADSVAEARAIDTYAPDIRAYIAGLEAPDYPFDVDQDLAAQGRAVFENTCSGCHGTYGEDWTYPNLVIALQEIGTDPALARTGMDGSDDRFMRWVSESFYGELSRLAPAPGYIAPPLDGVWATAPYLHNGSVPTIEGLLDSPKRPTYWTRAFDSRDFNQETLGWNYTELAAGKDAEPDSDQRKRIYDTTRHGYSNAGHLFGDGLTVEERRQVMEYLKTL